MPDASTTAACTPLQTQFDPQLPSADLGSPLSERCGNDDIPLDTPTPPKDCDREFTECDRGRTEEVTIVTPGGGLVTPPGGRCSRRSLDKSPCLQKPHGDLSFNGDDVQPESGSNPVSPCTDAGSTWWELEAPTSCGQMWTNKGGLREPPIKSPVEGIGVSSARHGADADGLGSMQPMS